MATGSFGGVGSSSLGQADLLKLLVTQVKSQDPLDPVKDTDFIAQLAQFSTLESLQTLNASFDQTLKLQELTGGADLIGQTVQYATAGNTTASGRVTGVAVQNGDVLLQIGNNAVPLNFIQGIIAP